MSCVVTLSSHWNVVTNKMTKVNLLFLLSVVTISIYCEVVTMCVITSNICCLEMNEILQINFFLNAKVVTIGSDGKVVKSKILSFLHF